MIHISTLLLCHDYSLYLKKTKPFPFQKFKNSGAISPNNLIPIYAIFA